MAEEFQEIMSEIIWQDPETQEQVRVTLSEFRDTTYFHLRRYYLGFDGYAPTKIGVSFPMTLVNTSKLLGAITKLLSKNEALEIILRHVDKDVLRGILNEQAPTEKDT